MTVMYDQQILEQLQKATTAAVEASTMPDLPVKYIGRTFKVPADQKYLEIVFIPNNRTGDFWGNEKNYRGLYRLILHWKNDDAGAYPPMIVLSSICAYFDKERLIGNVQITDLPDGIGAIEEGVEMLYPASIRYACHRP
jgi:hypothetical protein